MNGVTPIAIAIVRDGTRVLIGERPPDVALGGYWEFPGGKIESQEMPATAAVRECREETGLEVRVLKKLLLCRHQYAHGDVVLHFFECERIDAEQIAEAPYRWVEIQSLGEYRFPEANGEVLKLL